MSTITANGVTLHYERTGGDKPPVILLHGIRDCGRCWPRVAAALESSYDVIMLDARGHGDSSAPDTGYNYEALADDVAGAIAGLGLRQPAIVGHSMGAMTTAELAGRHPELVRCSVLEDPPWRYSEQTPDEWALVMDNFRASAVALQAMTDDEMVEYSLRINPRMALWDASDVSGWVYGKRHLSLCVMEDMRAHPQRWRQAVARIICPVLLMAGDAAKGGFCPPETVQQIQTLNPSIQIMHFPGVGHQIRREDFSEYMDAVTGFLGAHM